MSDTTYDLFADEEVPPLPPRSTLYHCTLIDEGTATQESLLNYLHRLAREHQVRVMDLLVQVVLPMTSINVERGRYGFKTAYARTVNGYNKYADELSAALVELTRNQNLRSATFLNWSGLFDAKGMGLLHPTRTWCPDCLANAESAGEPYNFPLLWSCLSVTHCSVHMRNLINQCPKCKALQQPICESAFYGRCSTCGASLGYQTALFSTNPPSRRQRFFYRVVGDMIALGPHAKWYAAPQRFAAGLRRIAEKNH